MSRVQYSLVVKDLVKIVSNLHDIKGCCVHSYIQRNKNLVKIVSNLHNLKGCCAHSYEQTNKKHFHSKNSTTVAYINYVTTVAYINYVR